MPKRKYILINCLFGNYYTPYTSRKLLFQTRVELVDESLKPEKKKVVKQQFVAVTITYPHTFVLSVLHVTG